jgi:predicted DNA-binding transcriptional regulator AlpA
MPTRRPREQTPPYPGAQYPAVVLDPTEDSAASHLQRQGDRGNTDDDAPARLPVLCRFCDLVAANITTSWAQLRNQIEREGFPRGVMLSKNVRAWAIRDVEAWLAERSSAPKVVNVEKAKKTRLQRKESIAEATTSSGT